MRRHATGDYSSVRPVSVVLLTYGISTLQMNIMSLSTSPILSTISTVWTYYVNHMGPIFSYGLLESPHESNIMLKEMLSDPALMSVLYK